MKLNKSTGGWLPFRHEDKSQIPGQDGYNVFSKEGLMVLVVIIALLIVGGFVYSFFFGPQPLT